MDSSEEFRRLYMEHADALRGFAMGLVPTDCVDDVVSETFLVAWRRWGEAESVSRSFLFGTARCAAANLRRSRRRWRELAERVETVGWWGCEPVTDPGCRAADKVAHEGVLDALTDGERRVLAELGWWGTPAADAAQREGVSVAAMQMRRSRARRQFRAAMRDVGLDTETTRFSDSGQHRLAQATSG